MAEYKLSPADTIAALSTGAGRAAVSVIRLSGPAVPAILEAFVGQIPRPRHAATLDISDPDSGELIDRGIVLYFPSPNSFTGQDVAEFQVHGSRAVVARLLGDLCRQSGLRAAEAGEFSRRAFENGKLDLLAIEDLSLLIDSDTELQRSWATGEKSSRFSALRTELA